ncbi:MAG TPA: carboxypeptidase-like regulatory domain-containing protein [Vineibacter sp.]|nr:carboxypeptidase-like regulatory domain-containing protein [Vineibacter sp.]
MRKTKQLAITAGILIAAAAPSLAQVDRSPQPPPPPDRLQQRPLEQATPGMRGDERRQRVDFVTGGVGKDEAERFRAMAPRYALALEFGRAGATRAEFEAFVDVTVIDVGGVQVLKTEARGPFLLANLPAGRYTVRAVSEGQVKTRDVSITQGQHQHVAFVW